MHRKRSQKMHNCRHMPLRTDMIIHYSCSAVGSLRGGGELGGGDEGGGGDGGGGPAMHRNRNTRNARLLLNASAYRHDRTLQLFSSGLTRRRWRIGRRR